MTPAERELQRRRLLARWWWLSEANAGLKCEAALAWETLRRTEFYPGLWKTFAREIRALIEAAREPSLAGVFQQVQLMQAIRAAIGQGYFNFLMSVFM